jgi:hypothetical protein
LIPILNSLETEEKKQKIYQKLTDYLKQRIVELEKLGGQDSPIYKREKAIILDVIKAYKLIPVDRPASIPQT